MRPRRHIWSILPRAGKIYDLWSKKSNTFWVIVTKLHFQISSRSVTSPNCTHCSTGSTDNIINHSFLCPTNKHVMDSLIETVKTVDATVTPTKLLLLDFEASSNIIENACVWIIVETLSFVWARRKAKKMVNKNELTNSLFGKAKILGLSSSFPSTSKLILQMIK